MRDQRRSKSGTAIAIFTACVITYSFQQPLVEISSKGFFRTAHTAQARTLMPQPRVVVFDLDACCWTPEMYQIGRGAPFKYDAAKCEATASGGDKVQLLGDVRAIWGELHSSELWRQTEVAIASRCDEPQWALELLSKFQVIPGVSMIEVANQRLVQIHSGNKKTHFAEISKASGVAFADMLFFDDDPWNIEQVFC